METLAEARTTIHKELTSDDSEVRSEYVKLFANEVNVFADEMARAFMVWRNLDTEASKDQQKSYVAALAYAAITLHILSFKLFLSGHIVAAGSIFRQVAESMALALLCSGKGRLVLVRFMEGKYSTNDAVRDVLRKGAKLGLKQDGLEALRSGQDFYHKYAHISPLTLASLISFSEDGIYVGACFDARKVDAYRKEVNGRVSLAKVFANFIEGVRTNVATW